MVKIKIGIVGYGNIGKGVEEAIKQNKDLETIAVFTRRNPKDIITLGTKVDSVTNIKKYEGIIDVMILCGGSAKDLQSQGPLIAKSFNTVDSYDTHAKIPEYFEEMNSIAVSSCTLSIISVGWDPGLFSLNRLLGQVILPNGTDYTFWGKGVSQGHSDAIRKIEGVSDAIEYTIPKDDALKAVRDGRNPKLTTREKHSRVCYVVVEQGVELQGIEREIKEMPNYFADYDTEVNFVSEEELKSNHSDMPHGGFVIRTGTTGENIKQKVEFSLQLDSNPQFTASVLVAYARAAHRLYEEGKRGALSVLDIPYSYLSSKSSETLRRELL